MSYPSSGHSTSTDNEPLTLKIQPGAPGMGELILRLSDELAASVVECGKDEGLRVSRVAEFSAGADVLSILAVAVAPGGALTVALKSVIDRVLARHEGKKVRLVVGQQELVIEGHATDETVAILERANQAILDQDARWGQITSLESPDIEEQHGE